MKRIPVILLVWVLSAFATSQVAAADRAWKDEQGEILARGSFERFEGDRVWIRRSDGRLVPLRWRRLSEADQDFVQDAELAAPENDRRPPFPKDDEELPLPPPTFRETRPAGKKLPRPSLPRDEKIGQPRKPAPEPPSSKGGKTQDAATEDSLSPVDSRNVDRAESNERGTATDSTKELAAGKPPRPKLPKKPQPSAEEAATEAETVQANAEGYFYQGAAGEFRIAGERGEATYRRNGRELEFSLVSATGPEPDAFRYYASEGGDERIKRWAFARRPETGRYAVWYETGGLWRFAGWTQRRRLQSAAFRSTPDESPPSEVRYEGLAGTFRIGSPDATARYRIGSTEHTAKLTPATGPKPNEFRYFTESEGHPRIRRWAIARRPEYAGLHAIWFEVDDTWQFHGWANRRVAR